MLRTPLRAILAPLFVLAGPVVAHAAWPSNPAVNVPVCTASGDQYMPAMIADGAGGAILAWVDHRGGYYSDVYAQRLNAAGSALWSADGVAVVDSRVDQECVNLVSDGAGGAIVLWIDRTSGYSDLYAQRIGADGSRLWTATGVPVSVGRFSNSTEPVSMTADGAGGAILAWVDYPSGLATIRAQRLDATGAPAWGASGLVVRQAPVGMWKPRVVSDGAGGAIVAWQDERSFPGYDLYAQRISAAGALRWAAAGAAVCTAAGEQRDLEVIADGAGGAIVAWLDWRSGSSDDVYAQRVDSSGVVRWGTNGVPVGAGTDLDLAVMLVSDGAGGAVFDRISIDAASSLTAHAHRLDALGSPPWGATGVPLGTLDIAGYEEMEFAYPMFAADGAGGAIMAWWARHGGAFDISAQRVTAAGTLAWPAGGVAVSTAGGDQERSTLVPDGAGGAIVAWQDGRVASWDVWAQRVDAAGQPGGTTGVAPVVPRALRLDSPVPNPARGRVSLVFALPDAGRVRLAIHDLQGREVCRLLDDVVPAGPRSVSWDGRDDAGRELAGGVYFAKLTSAGNSRQVRIVHLH